MIIEIVETIGDSRVQYPTFSVDVNIIGPPHLSAPRPCDKPTLFAVLHELGHVQHATLRSMRRYMGPHSGKMWQLTRKVMEIRAWQYAASCVKSAYRKELARFSRYYLNTHFSCAQKDIDRWLLRENRYLR